MEISFFTVLFRCLCNVHQSTPKFRSKFRSRTRKCANQNGRPSRSLKSKRERQRTQEETPQTKREEDDGSTLKLAEKPGIVPSHSEIADFCNELARNPDIPYSRKIKKTAESVEKRWECQF